MNKVTIHWMIFEWKWSSRLSPYTSWRERERERILGIFVLRWGGGGEKRCSRLSDNGGKTVYNDSNALNVTRGRGLFETRLKEIQYFVG